MAQTDSNLQSCVHVQVPRLLVLPPCLTVLFLCFPWSRPLLEILLLNSFLCFLLFKSSSLSEVHDHCLPSSVYLNTCLCSQRLTSISRFQVLPIWMGWSRYTSSLNPTSPAFCLLSAEMPGLTTLHAEFPHKSCLKCGVKGYCCTHFISSWSFLFLFSLFLPSLPSWAWSIRHLCEASERALGASVRLRASSLFLSVFLWFLTL